MRLVRVPSGPLVWCLLVMLFYELGAGAIVATPWVGAAWPLAAGPEADRAMFADPSAVVLLELGRLVLPVVRARSVWLAFFTAGLLGLAPLALVLACVARRVPLVGSAVRLLPRLILLWGAAILAQALFAVAVVLGGQRLAGALEPGPWADPASLGVFVLAALVVLAVGVVSDVARVAAARGAGLYASVESALHVVWARLGAVIFVFCSRGLAGLWLVATGAALARELARGPDLWLAPALLLGQLGLFASLVLRADWLRFAAEELEAREHEPS